MRVDFDVMGREESPAEAVVATAAAAAARNSAMRHGGGKGASSHFLALCTALLQQGPRPIFPAGVCVAVIRSPNVLLPCIRRVHAAFLCGAICNDYDLLPHTVCMRCCCWWWWCVERHLMFCSHTPLCTRCFCCCVGQYLGGLLDLTGELNRFAVARATKRDAVGVKECLETVLVVRISLVLFCVLDATPQFPVFFTSACGPVSFGVRRRRLLFWRDRRPTKQTALGLLQPCQDMQNLPPPLSLSFFVVGIVWVVWY